MKTHIMFQDTETLSPQEYRDSALNWQLFALKAQTEAIEQIGREHSITFEDVSPSQICKRVQELVETGRGIAAGAAGSDPCFVINQIKGLRRTAEVLRSDAASFARSADARAAFRMSGLIPTLAEQDSSEESGVEATGTHDLHEKLVPDARKLAVASAHRCLRAETEQHNTFVSQVNAICDLALEMVLSAAADAAPQQI